MADRLMRFRALLATGAITVAALLAAPTVAEAKGLDCAHLPYGATGCDGYLGAKVRGALAVRGIHLANVENTMLGWVVEDLCFKGAPGPELEITTDHPDTRDIALNLRTLQEIKGPFCG